MVGAVKYRTDRVIIGSCFATDRNAGTDKSAEEYLDLSENEQKRKAYDKMMEAIKEILDEMRKSEE